VEALALKPWLLRLGAAPSGRDARERCPGIHTADLGRGAGARRRAVGPGAGRHRYRPTRRGAERAHRLRLARPAIGCRGGRNRRSASSRSSSRRNILPDPGPCGIFYLATAEENPLTSARSAPKLPPISVHLAEHRSLAGPPGSGNTVLTDPRTDPGFPETGLCGAPVGPSRFARGAVG
jgi:hypothetical protein